MGAKDRIGTTITEKQFLELSDRERDRFVASFVLGCSVKKREGVWGFYHYCDCKIAPHGDFSFPSRLPRRVVHFTTTWQGMGKGIEHANENGFDVTLEQRHKLWDIMVWDDKRQCVGISRHRENIFLAFWIAYMKALGVISEKTG